MNAPWRRGRVREFALVLAVLSVGLHDAVLANPPEDRERASAPGIDPARPTPPPALWTPRWSTPPPPDASAGRPAAARSGPRWYLIYLIDGGEPIVVTRYVEAGGQIVFEKYGGWVRIPTYEVLRIVSDTPDPSERTANLPPSAPVDPGGVPFRPDPELYLTMRGGGQLRVAALTPDGEHVRVSLANGSFTVPRSEVVSVVRVPPGSDVPEAWLSLLITDPEDRAALQSSGLVPPTPEPRLPYQSSDRPHFLRLGNGQLMHVDGFWVEDGEFRFRRLGGIVGVAVDEVLRLFPEEIAPVRGRTPVRYVRQVAADLLEVSVRSGRHRVRLVGVEPVGGAWTADSPWQKLEPGLVVHLEFDRQRYDGEGNWLAYVFLPNGRMLNAELVRLGLARPVSDGRNARYADLFHEMGTLETPEPTPE